MWSDDITSPFDFDGFIGDTSIGKGDEGFVSFGQTGRSVDFLLMVSGEEKKGKLHA